MISFTILLLCVYCSITNTVSGQNCENLTQPSGEIYDNLPWSKHRVTKCWFIQIPKDSYLRLHFTEFNLGNSYCSIEHISIFINGVNETYTLCQKSVRNLITALDDVKVTYYRSPSGHSSSFRLRYTSENFVCAQKNHFRCSPNFCIHDHQVCNGVKDCENGNDEDGCEKGITDMKEMNVSRINAINWLKNQRRESFGWGKNTHRAITALYLSKAMMFQGEDLEEEITAKQLAFQTSEALLRNASNPISISELSMFVNALTVTCHNPRNFHGYDLVQILSDRVASAKSPVPSAYLTLCNLNWTISDFEVENLVDLLHKNSKYLFRLDVRSLAVMALTCIRNKTRHFRNIAYAESTYKSTVQNVAGQLPDGSFGNVYTTALVTQALIASGQEESKLLNTTAATRYLMKQLNSTADFLSVYLSLPIFSGRSLVDIKATHCLNKIRKEGKDKEISEVTDKLSRKMRIQYSLYIGDEKDVVHTIYMRMPEKSSAFDLMRVAQVENSLFKFFYRDVSGQMYIYEIAGIVNDPEAEKFWLLYTGDHYVNGTAEHHTDSPDKFTLRDNDHVIMWYRTAHI